MCAFLTRNLHILLILHTLYILSFRYILYFLAGFQLLYMLYRFRMLNMLRIPRIDLDLSILHMPQNLGIIFILRISYILENSLGVGRFGGHPWGPTSRVPLSESVGNFTQHRVGTKNVEIMSVRAWPPFRQRG